MGMFNLFKTKQEQPSPLPEIKQPNSGVVLNLQKDQILNLTKATPVLNKIRVSAGWDVNTNGPDYDLDLCAILLDANNRLVKCCNSCVYYGKKDSKGIYLDGDNLTGEGDGDDENIFVTLEAIPQDVKRILFNVVIYDAHARGQSFKKVQNAYVRIVNEELNNTEICRYKLTYAFCTFLKL